MSHLFLMGYRGTGKSTVGKRLSQQLGLTWADTDQLIEQAAGCTISDIFATQGEPAFRALEHSIVKSFEPRKEACVVSLGGGAILREDNRAMIRQGYRVWLQGSAEVLYERTCQDASSQTRRPRLSDRSGIEEVRELLALREPLYAELAQFTVMTDSLRPEEIVARITGWLESTDWKKELR